MPTEFTFVVAGSENFEAILAGRWLFDMARFFLFCAPLYT